MRSRPRAMTGVSDIMIGCQTLKKGGSKDDVPYSAGGRTALVVCVGLG